MSNKGELFPNELGGWLEIKRLKIVDEEENKQVTLETHKC